MRTPRNDTNMLQHMKKDIIALCKHTFVTNAVLLSSELDKLEGTFWEKKSLLKKLCSGTCLKILIVPNAVKIEDIDTQKKILADCHFSKYAGHPGRDKMYKSLRERYYWPSMYKNIQDLVKSCEKCQKGKYFVIPKEPLKITSTSTTSLEKIFLDLYGPLIPSNEGNKYVLTLQDDLSKFSLAFPVKDKSASTIAKTLVENYFCIFGFPNSILTDQGTEFINEVMNEICSILEIDKLSSSAYHHETLGSIENSHKRLGNFLRTSCGKSPNWEAWLPFFVYSYNTYQHEATGYSPFELVFSKKPRFPTEIVKSKIDPVYDIESYVKEMKYRYQIANKEARENQIELKKIRKQNYDTKIKRKFKDFKIGDLVLIKKENNHKLELIYNGPFEILDVDESNVFIKTGPNISKVHKNRVKLFNS